MAGEHRKKPSDVIPISEKHRDDGTLSPGQRLHKIERMMQDHELDDEVKHIELWKELNALKLDHTEDKSQRAGALWLTNMLIALIGVLAAAAAIFSFFKQ